MPSIEDIQEQLTVAERTANSYRDASVRNARDAEEYERRVVALRAQLAAESAKEAEKTEGQRIAEKLISVAGSAGNLIRIGCGDRLYRPYCSDPELQVYIDHARKQVADVIDIALADDRAAIETTDIIDVAVAKARQEQREACEKAVDALAFTFGPNCNTPVVAVSTALHAIRNAK